MTQPNNADQPERMFIAGTTVPRDPARGAGGARELPRDPHAEDAQRVYDEIRAGLDPDLAERFRELDELDEIGTDVAMDEERLAYRRQVAELADALSLDEARAIVEEADQLREHTNSCGAEVSQCDVCASQVGDGDPGLWEFGEPAARHKLAAHQQREDHSTTRAGAEGERCREAVQQARDAVDRLHNQRVEQQSDNQDRAEQIARWRADDQAAKDTDADADGDGAGW